MCEKVGKWEEQFIDYYKEAYIKIQLRRIKALNSGSNIIFNFKNFLSFFMAISRKENMFLHYLNSEHFTY